jgi:hypothetical protein
LNRKALLNIPIATLRESTCKRKQKGSCCGHIASETVWPNNYGQTIYDGNHSFSQSTCHLPGHAERSELNFVAPLNIPRVSVTLEVFHCDRSWLKAVANWNIVFMDVTFDTSHDPILPLKSSLLENFFQGQGTRKKV